MNRPTLISEAGKKKKKKKKKTRPQVVEVPKQPWPPITQDHTFLSTQVPPPQAQCQSPPTTKPANWSQMSRTKQRNWLKTSSIIKWGWVTVSNCFRV